MKQVISIIFVLISISICGCALLNHEAPLEDVDKAAALFFQRLDKQQLDLIYDDSSTQFKKNKTRETVLENLKQLTAYGHVVDSQRTSMTMEGSGKGRMVFPAYAATFEQARGELSLTFQDENGEWKLFGFQFKPRR